MSKILSIARVVYKESLRNRVILALIAMSILIIFLSVFISPIALGETERIIKDIGLSSISFFSMLIVLLAGTRLVYQEIEKKTIYLIVTKPVSRAQLIMGKYMGLLMIILTITAISGIFLILTVLVFNAGFTVNIVYAIILIFMQFALLSAIAVFFSTFTSPVLSGLFTLMIYIIGYLIKDLGFFINSTVSIAVKLLIRAVMLIIPNFYYTDIKLHTVNNIPVCTDYIFFTVAYMLIYTVFFIYVSTIIFERKEF